MKARRKRKRASTAPKDHVYKLMWQQGMKQALERGRSLGFRDGVRHGIEQAVVAARDYDKVSTHPYLVSECILQQCTGKGTPSRSPHAALYARKASE